LAWRAQRATGTASILPRMRKVLELPSLRRLLAAAVLNELAWSIGSVSLSLLVYKRTGSAIGAAAFFLCSQFAPALISPLLVARLDRRPVAGILGGLYAAEAAIFLILAWLVGRFAVAPVLALTLIDGILAVTARVLARAAWSSLTSASGVLREANAIVNTSLAASFMVGPAVGGVVVALDGTAAALLVNVGLFALSSVGVITARGLPREMAAHESSARRVRRALAYARADLALRRLLGLEAVAFLFFTISIPVEVVLARHSLHAGAGGYGFLLSAWGAGGVVGGVIYARWRSLPSREMITLGTCAFGIGFLTMAVAPSLAVAVVGSAIGGIGNGIQVVAFRTAVQEAASAEWMALVLSLVEFIFQAVPGAGILVGGVTATVAGPRVALAAAAAGSFATSVATWTGLRPIARRHDQPTHADAQSVEIASKP
jgi:hypothetical protein